MLGRATRDPTLSLVDLAYWGEAASKEAVSRGQRSDPTTGVNPYVA